MDKIKQKMAALKEENDRAEARIAELEKQLRVYESSNHKHEQEAETLSKKLQSLDDSLANAEAQLQDLQHQAKTFEKQAEEHQREAAVLKSNDSHLSKFGQLESKLKETLAKYAEVKRKYEDTLKRVVVIEQDLERAEERAELAEEKAKSLEVTHTQLDSSLRSLKVAKTNANNNDARSLERVKQLESLTAAAKKELDALTKKVHDLETQNEKLQDNLEVSHTRYRKAKEELEVTLAELGAL